MDRVFLDATHRQVIVQIKQREPESLNQAVLGGALLGEYLVKKTLIAVNPIAPYRLDYLNTAHSDFSALISGSATSEKLKFEDIGILLDRSKALNSLDVNAIELIAKIKTDRNGIMHDPEYKCDALETQARLIKLFTEYKALFEEHLSVQMEAAVVSELQNTLRHVESEIANRLGNKISRAREAFTALSKVEKEQRLAQSIEETGAEDMLVSGLACPACKNKTLHYLLAVDVDADVDGITYSSSTWFECTACGLGMSEYDFDDLYDNPQEYMGRPNPDPTWQEYYDYKEHTENAYEYM